MRIFRWRVLTLALLFVGSSGYYPRGDGAARSSQGQLLAPGVE